MDSTPSSDNGSVNHQAPDLPRLTGLPLNIAILSYGTRGDIQPFIRITQALLSDGHRVRLTVPPSLEAWVRDTYGLETWNLGHDMGKFTRWGLHKPSRKLLSMVNGEFRDLKGHMRELLVEHWRACVDEGKGPEPGDHRRPFVADVIIASPPGMTHVHIAQRLGVPLLLTHFNPKTITRHWPHGDRYPSENVFKPCDENRESWISGDTRIWKHYYKGIVNKIRKQHLDLPPLGGTFWPLEFWQIPIPSLYLISPTVLPRPDDFPSHHHFVGFTHLDQSHTFTPKPELIDFLSGSSGPIVYVDFGSNEWLDRRGLTDMVVKAVAKVNAKALVRKAWYVREEVPEGVFVTEELPHQWLFPRVDLILHSAGAGCTAISLKCGVPSVAVPFRGDQHLWSKTIERLGASPPAARVHDLTEAKLADLLRQGLEPKYAKAARKAAETLRNEEDGALAVTRMLHTHLEHIDGYPKPCSLLPDRQAVWAIRGDERIQLSAIAAHILEERGIISHSQLELLRVVDWDKYQSLKPWGSRRDRRDDVVRKQRIAQGAFDATNASENVSEQVIERWRDLHAETTCTDGGH